MKGISLNYRIHQIVHLDLMFSIKVQSGGTGPFKLRPERTKAGRQEVDLLDESHQSSLANKNP